jgi:hypothetical protein
VYHAVAIWLALRTSRRDTSCLLQEPAVLTTCLVVVAVAAAVAAVDVVVVVDAVVAVGVFVAVGVVAVVSVVVVVACFRRENWLGCKLNWLFHLFASFLSFTITNDNATMTSKCNYFSIYSGILESVCTQRKPYILT